MATIHPHLHFNGNAEEAFQFYKSVFDGEISKLMRFEELIKMGYDFDKKEDNKIMHIALLFGTNNVLTGSDVPDILGQVSEEENRSKISVTTDSKVEADNIFAALSIGGVVEMPLSNSPWGSYFGMLRDKYGIEWMIEFNQ
jgi:PhnB protein